MSEPDGGIDRSVETDGPSIFDGLPVGDGVPLSMPARLPSLLWHYTNRRGLLGILTSRQLWATHIFYLNDSSEVAYSVEMYCRLAEKMRGPEIPAIRSRLSADLVLMAQRMNADPQNCVFCLSEERDDLSQWRAYGQPGSSYAIGFDVELLAKVVDASHTWGLLPCEYDEKKQKQLLTRIIDTAVTIANRAESLTPRVEEELSALAAASAFALTRTGATLKHPRFSGEREWRLITTSSRTRLPAYREGSGFVIPYLEIPIGPSLTETPIREIVVGPSAHADLDRAAIKGMVDGFGASSISVSNSTIPFRNW